METKIVSAVGLAHTPQACSKQKEAARRAKRLVCNVIDKLPVSVARKQRLTMEAFSAIHLLFGLGAFSIGGGSIGDTFENDVMRLIFNATAIANIADNAASAPLTNLFVSLHTSDPGEAGNQTTNEIAYTSYARATVARSGGGWTVTANSVSPAANIDFAAGTGGSGTATHFAVGTALSSTGKVLFKGTVSPNIVCGNGITPRLTTATAITLD